MSRRIVNQISFSLNSYINICSFFLKIKETNIIQISIQNIIIITEKS
jgi:hypothetical protein